MVRLNQRRPAQALPALEAALALDPTAAHLHRAVGELRAFLAQNPAAGRVALVADAGATPRKLAGHALARAGYDVREAASAEAALEAGVPDLFLIDEALPGGGVELCKRLKSRPETRPVPVVVTGRGGYFGRARARRAGAGEYLVKPCRPAELLAALAAAR